MLGELRDIVECRLRDEHFERFLGATDEHVKRFCRRGAVDNSANRARRSALRAADGRCIPVLTQNNLGNALQTLGERESGTARLEEAVSAYRNAPLEHTRERVPLQWAMTQHNLGTALWTLGERESETARLEEAVNRDALLERTRERVPLQWAMTQNNLGTALQTLGERESGTYLSRMHHRRCPFYAKS
jgi:tetratricopeptide (TPR) repeat protein